MSYYVANDINDYSPSFCLIDYTGQNGTPSGVRDGATATVDTYAGNGVLTTKATASFTNVQSMFRFLFTDGTSTISVKSLRITSNNGALVKCYYPLISSTSEKYSYGPSALA